LHKKAKFYLWEKKSQSVAMTPVALPRPIAAPSLSFRPLLRRLAGSGGTEMPTDMEDWQLRDLALTRPFAGPCRSLFFWLP
jgi:hypothetical protein